MSNQGKPKSPHSFKTYICSYLGGYASGIAGEIVSLALSGKINSSGFVSASFSENCFQSAIQQVAKDFTKNELKRHSYFLKLSKDHPFLFGAATGLPMWALTKLVTVPMNHIRHDDTKVFYGIQKPIREEMMYHTIKNGLDELCISKVFPSILPHLDSPVTRKLVEGSIAGFVGGFSHIFSWPYKHSITKQTLPAAYDATLKAIPKVATKKIVYTLSRPQICKLIQ